MKFHPATQIMAWGMLVAAMQALTLNALLISAGFAMSCALLLSWHKFMQLVRRTRWVMLSLLLVYAYSTPGEALSDALGVFGPSREGLTDGVLQLTRLLAALAGLAVLLERLHRQQLIAGLYTLFAPLRFIGLSRERFAVRLALTLHYAEVAMLRDTHRWQDALIGLFEPVSGDSDHRTEARKLELPLFRFTAADALLTGFSLLLLWLAWR